MSYFKIKQDVLNDVAKRLVEIPYKYVAEILQILQKNTEVLEEPKKEETDSK